MRTLMDGRNGENMAKGKRRNGGLFSDISAAQVIATALAAVTSMLLSSYIGIAGSVIGVAVASVVSTLAASAYKKFLRDSAEKIKELPLPIVHAGTLKPHGIESEAAETGGEPPKAVSEHAAENDVDGPSGDERPSADGKNSAGAHDGEPANSDADAIPEANDAAASSAESAAEPDRRRLIRGLVIVCVVSALLTVAVSGAAVYLLTTGEGLGTRPAPIYVSVPQSSAPHDSGPSAPDADASDSGKKDGSDASSSASSGSFASSSASSASSSSSSSSSSNSGSSSSSASSSGSSSASSNASSSSGGGPSSKDDVDAAGSTASEPSANPTSGVTSPR